MAKSEAVAVQRGSGWDSSNGRLGTFAVAAMAFNFTASYFLLTWLGPGMVEGAYSVLLELWK